VYNHAFEFEPLVNLKLFDLIFEELPKADFIPDVCWIKFASENF